jgi:hypothetical protein
VVSTQSTTRYEIDVFFFFFFFLVVNNKFYLEDLQDFIHLTSNAI